MTREETIRLKAMRSVLWGAMDTIGTIYPANERDEFTDKLIDRLAIESNKISRKLEAEGVEKPFGEDGNG